MWKAPRIRRAEAIALRFEPTYPVGTAASFVGMSATTLKTWVQGREYRTSQGTRFWPPPIVPDGEASLSFANLVEAHALLVLRKEHEIDMRKIRQAIEFVSSRLGIERPLIDQRFRTDGLDLFVQNAYGDTVAASDQGQRIIRGFERLLQRVQYDEDDLAERLLPLSRRPIESHDDQPDAVAIDPLIAGGLPILRRAGVATRIVMQRFIAGETTHDLAEDYGVDVSDIEEAVRWEHGTRSRAA